MHFELQRQVPRLLPRSCPLDVLRREGPIRGQADRDALGDPEELLGQERRQRGTAAQSLADERLLGQDDVRDDAPALHGNDAVSGADDSAVVGREHDCSALLAGELAQ